MSIHLKNHKTIINLPNNLRFYVLMLSVLISLTIVSWLRVHIPNNQLFIIRTEQIFGVASLFYLYIALITSPLSKVLGKEGWMQYLLFARRAVGVSAAYFAFLHIMVALYGQIGGLAGVMLLPNLFKWSLGFGLIAFIVLLLMTATSFDAVINFMTLRKWKWLHRLVYGAGILIILHVWILGTHIAYTLPQFIAFTALAIFIGLEALRVANNMAKKHVRLKQKEIFISLVLGLWLPWLLLLLALPKLVTSYQSQHANSSHSHQDGQE